MITHFADALHAWHWQDSDANASGWTWTDGPSTRSQTWSGLSKMMRLVQNEKFTFEIDSENALVGVHWNAEEVPSSEFQLPKT
jgi:hypothetical protein